MKNLLFTPIIAVVLMISGCEAELEEKDKPKDPEKLKVAVLVTEGFHDGEAFMPMGYLANKGAFMIVIGPEKGTVKAYNSDFTINIQKAVEDVSVDYFDALIIPGGEAPAKLRKNEKVVDFAAEFVESGKTVAAICHGPQVLITAGVLEGRSATGFEGIKDELEEAGVNYKDEPVVKDENIITSRTPPDLYDFSKAISKSIMTKEK